MFIIIGIVVVFGSIIAGYLMEHGNLKVLVQPAELLIIGGAAIGTLLIANPLHVIKKIVGGVMGAMKGSHFNQSFYLETLKMCYEILNKARKDGLLAIGYRRARKKRSVLKVSKILEGPSHAGFRLRHAANGGYGRN